MIELNEGISGEFCENGVMFPFCLADERNFFWGFKVVKPSGYGVFPYL